MKKDLGDHIGKKKGWVWYELGEIIILAIKNIDFSKLFKNKK
jgi:hypothetical protein